MRLRASELRAKMNVSDKWLRMHNLSKDKLKKASGGLIFLSNALFNGEAIENHQQRKEIENLLNIENE